MLLQGDTPVVWVHDRLLSLLPPLAPHHFTAGWREALSKSTSVNISSFDRLTKRRNMLRIDYV